MRAFAFLHGSDFIHKGASIMTSALEGGGGSGKAADKIRMASKGGCVKMWTRGRGARFFLRDITKSLPRARHARAVLHCHWARNSHISWVSTRDFNFLFNVLLLPSRKCECAYFTEPFHLYIGYSMLILYLAWNCTTSVWFDEMIQAWNVKSYYLSNRVIEAHIFLLANWCLTTWIRQNKAWGFIFAKGSK